MAKYLCAVYGTLRQELYNHYLMQHSKFLTKGITQDNCTMYSRVGFPILSFHEGTEPAVVEIYEIDEATLRNLDRLEGYREGEDSWYNRSVKTFRGDNGEYYDAFIYHQDRATEMPVVAGGDWCKYRGRYL